MDALTVTTSLPIRQARKLGQACTDNRHSRSVTFRHDRVVATDGHFLAWFPAPLEGDGADALREDGFSIPGEDLAKWAKGGKGSGDLELRLQVTPGGDPLLLTAERPDGATYRMDAEDLAAAHTEGQRPARSLLHAVCDSVKGPLLHLSLDVDKLAALVDLAKAGGGGSIVTLGIQPHLEPDDKLGTAHTAVLVASTALDPTNGGPEPYGLLMPVKAPAKPARQVSRAQWPSHGEEAL